jgi:hypothetical protein
MIVHLYIMQIVRLLLNFRSFFHCKVDISAKNSRGLTAFDMLQGDNQQIIKDMLRRASCFSTLHLPRVASNADYLKSPVPIDEKIYILFLRQSTKMTNDTRNILLVVAALLVTVTSKQATLSPPGRVWQDDSSPTTNTSNSIAPASPTSHFAGTTIMDEYLFFILAALNLISFCVTVFTIFVLLPGGFRSGLFIVPLYILSLCFVASLLITAPVDIDGGHSAAISLMFSPLMVMFLEAIVRLRRRKLFQAFLPKLKLLDPTLI